MGTGKTRVARIAMLVGIALVLGIVADMWGDGVDRSTVETAAGPVPVTPTSVDRAPAVDQEAMPAPVHFNGRALRFPWPASLDLESLVAVQNAEFELWDALTVACMADRGFEYTPDPAVVAGDPGSTGSAADPNMTSYQKLTAAEQRSFSSALAEVDDVYSVSPSPAPSSEGVGCIERSRQIYRGFEATDSELVDAAIEAYVGPQNECLADHDRKNDRRAAPPTPRVPAPCGQAAISDVSTFAAQNGKRISDLRKALARDFEDTCRPPAARDHAGAS